MPNGYDRNWIRLCAAIHGFRDRYGFWPTRVRMSALALEDLRQNVFTPEAMRKIEQQIQLIADEASMVAEDDLGRQYSYGREGFPRGERVVHAETWLGVVPDRPNNEFDYISCE